MHMATETSAEAILAILTAQKPDIVVIDSVQTIFSEQLEGAPGSVSQIRESAALLLRFAKTNATALFLIGHVTKEGAIAGPRVLEHMVDTVLSFEGDSAYQYRIVRAVRESVRAFRRNRPAFDVGQRLVRGAERFRIFPA